MIFRPPKEWIVYEPRVRSLCLKSYVGHPNGCPNYSKRDTCPPRAPHLPDYFDLDQPTFLIVNAFDLGAHVDRMQAKHPDWSDRQLRCCYYWQGTARKALRAEIDQFWVAAKDYYDPELIPAFEVTTCPEAMGLNVTATCANLNLKLEWPPVHIAHQIAFVGVRR